MTSACRLLAFIFALIVPLAAVAQEADKAGRSSSQNLLLCAGQDEMFVIDADAAEQGAGEKLWSWKAANLPDATPELIKQFNNLDECRAIRGGTQILLTASNGGCALIDRSTSKMLWKGYATNAHSIELLPNNRVVVASSVNGNRLILFDLAKSDAPQFQTPLHSAHGVIWDESRKLLWAIGFDQLQTYELVDWESDKPSLRLVDQYELPTEGGHDLRAVPNSADLILSTHEHVYLFDRNEKKFRLHPEAADLEHVKAADVNPETGRLLIGFWKSEMRFFSPAGAITFPANKPYKIRWLAEAK
ncbi:DUF6528 family protein [Blastopirellula sp. JC732]|uniref:DUF6528 family protein n=1 Tax=Blastopirellula sediminis TaxID=2894196 RepID=A0A9X1MSG8_9BACT|nr:DUF6528 family protein [Blastopirellula sediminis]MCC9604750.1 DUF6528 family protein [Blastopirellula sediminis]MCC9631951.1 DUF6528 family protein [Blastopirellula sediminis]